jgi:hypothetical protein
MGVILKYLYLCGGTPKIIKILVVVSQIIDGVPTPPGIFSWKSPNKTWKNMSIGHDFRMHMIRAK